MLLIALAATALALVACSGGYNPNNLYGTPLPSASPTPPTTPNPTISSAVVTVTLLGLPLPSQPVGLYADNGGHVGAPITSQTTTAAGTATFAGLTPASNYCFKSTYTPSAAGSLPQSQTVCTDLWGFGITISF